jgi:uncharacterized membrane protein
MEVSLQPKSRINSIDVLRGLIMVIMALDHVRDFFHADAFVHDPLDVKTTTPVLYFTRFITHYCAPTFVFLAGISAYLSGLRRTTAALGVFLIKRGIWLIFVELIIIGFAASFNPFFSMMFLQVIWAIGISMVILGLLVILKIPHSVIFLLGLLIIFGHNLLDYPEIEKNYQVGFWWDLVHAGRFTPYQIAPGHTIIIAYAFLPWTGIMLAGYGFGKLFERSVMPSERKKILLATGFSLIALFLILRFINQYGDPVKWSVQDTPMKTFLSFMNVSKYPHSLMYICITLGPSLIFLALIEGVSNRFTSFVEIYGRVPFFYYVLHFFLIHALSTIAFFLSGYGVKDIVTPGFPFYFRPPSFGFSLWVVYVVWIGVILLLYPLCKKYDRYKSTHRQWWLSYI